MIDVHCHLNFHPFEKNIDEVVAAARLAGVKAIVNVGTSLESSIKAVELAHKFSDMYAIVGIHPHHADKLVPGLQSSSPPAGLKVTGDWIGELEKIALSSTKVIGIGEIGLDYYSYKSNGIVDPKIQKEVFIKQIELAHKLNLPLQIHNRHAGEDVVDVLKKFKHLLKDVPGMFHCFAATIEVLKEVLDMVFYIGFDGNITYKGLAPGETVELKDLAINTPLDRIFVETDSPYLTPVPLRGAQNKPENVIITAQFIAGIKNKTNTYFQQTIYNNFRTVFGVEIK